MLLDGLEITQFTYFQQVGGIDLAPISCEITYGLERIAMFLQRVDNVFDLEWGGGVKYRRGAAAGRDRAVEVRVRPGGHAGRPSSPRSIATCSTSTSRSPARCSTRASIWPALEHCLKCSHLFNILDSSGSIGVTERTAYILRVRQLAVRIAKALRRGHDARRTRPRA